MNAEIHVQSGARAGLVTRLLREDITVGRHPDCGLQLHPTLDLEVSTRHALIQRVGERWLIRDLGSRNGTMINGRRIATETTLFDGDQIRLGMTGPILEFQRVGLRAATATPPLPATAGSAPLTHAATAAAERERAGRALLQTRRLRWLSAGLTVTLLALMTAYHWSSRQRHAAWETERGAMQLRIDSLLVTSEASARAIEGMLGGLTAALRRSQDEVREVGARLRRAEAAGDRTQISSLRRRLESATVALDRQQAAATLDFRGIERRNRRAVAKVYVEYENGEVATATAFAVRADATLITSRHVVAGSDAHRGLRRIAAQFADSDQIWPARVVRVAEDADLALVKIDNILGRVPTVQALNLRSDTVAAGAPVALIGFPLGGEAETMNGTAPHLARPVLTAGVVSNRSEHRLELHGYGAAGASGSPIFDGNGEVVGVLFGGRREDGGGQTLFSVPSAVVSRLIESLR